MANNTFLVSISSVLGTVKAIQGDLRFHSFLDSNATYAQTFLCTLIYVSSFLIKITMNTSNICDCTEAKMNGLQQKDSNLTLLSNEHTWEDLILTAKCLTNTTASWHNAAYSGHSF